MGAQEIGGGGRRQTGTRLLLLLLDETMDLEPVGAATVTGAALGHADK